ncbi:2OG-Fe(II) oxygenase family protein [soil metagenome]
MNEPPFEIDPLYANRRLQPFFETAGRLHLPGILTDAGAERLHGALSRTTVWTRSTLGRGTPIDVPTEALEQATDAEQAAFAQAGHVEARDGFHYMFDSYRISELIESGVVVDPDLSAFYDWLNSEPFLAFARRLSGLDDLAYVDAQATRYLPGHYLNVHDDEKAGAGRKLAYVLNLTARWRPDWGGLLAFTDAEGHVSEAYAPVFNGLNIFRVPQSHMVTHIAPFAGQPRLSITGWIRSHH